MRSLFLFFLFSYSTAWPQIRFLPSSVVDKPDFITVSPDLSNIPSKYHHIADAVGRISMGCTATHIGNGLVISAGHCFKALPVETAGYCEGITVNWGYRAPETHSMVSKCLRVLIMQNVGALDYALFQVHPYPKAYVEMEWNTQKVDGRLTTVFSHPKGRPLQWSQYCHARYLTPAPKDPGLLYHQCDTQPGSSGAALIDAETRRVIGIHKGGLEFPDIGVWNYGNPIHATPLDRLIGNRRAAR